MVDNQQWTAPSLEQALEIARGILPREFQSWDEVPGRSRLLPTPAVNDMGAGKTVEAWDEWTAKMQAKHGNGNGHGPSLAIEAQRLLPTPVADHSRGLPQPGTDFQSLPNVVVSLLPTPTAQDAVGSRNSTHQRPPGSTAHIGDTLTDAATVLTGARTRARSVDGSSPPDALPLDPPNPDVAESA